jgi:hypothetical protein
MVLDIGDDHGLDAIPRRPEESLIFWVFSSTLLVSEYVFSSPLVGVAKIVRAISDYRSVSRV